VIFVEKVIRDTSLQAHRGQGYLHLIGKGSIIRFTMKFWHMVLLGLVALGMTVTAHGDRHEAEHQPDYEVESEPEGTPESEPEPEPEITSEPEAEPHSIGSSLAATSVISLIVPLEIGAFYQR
ncbi:unnamed protein product, partial [Meganyctiphanes norvegica]